MTVEVKICGLSTPETVAELLENSGGIIVGSGIKVGGDPSAPIDKALATAFASAAGRR